LPSHISHRRSRSWYGYLFFIFYFFLISPNTLFTAYLTNPSENSFRAFLIEQSFRQHLTRLDVNPDDDSHDNSTSSPNSHTLSFDNSSPFHFANRASISLRTPKHVFHSFGIITIAAMVPLPKSSSDNHRDTLIISDSWYVGAFGRWWRGGIIDAWYQDIIARSSDEEGWTSGILSMKNLDLLTEYNGMFIASSRLSLISSPLYRTSFFHKESSTSSARSWFSSQTQKP
jgi:hypothetical protein